MLKLFFDASKFKNTNSPLHSSLCYMFVHAPSLVPFHNVECSSGQQGKRAALTRTLTVADSWRILTNILACIMQLSSNKVGHTSSWCSSGCCIATYIQECSRTRLRQSREIQGRLREECFALSPSLV